MFLNSHNTWPDQLASHIPQNISTHLSVNTLYIITLASLHHSCSRERTINRFVAPSSAHKATLQQARVALCHQPVVVLIIVQRFQTTRLLLFLKCIIYLHFKVT